VEYVCSRIAHEVAGSPGVEILDVTPEFLEALRSAGSPASNLARAVPGPHLGIAWQDQAPTLAHTPDAVEHLSSDTQFGTIIGCDTLLQNRDRHRGNILVRPFMDRRKKPGKRVLVPIDWGDCFEGSGVEPVKLAEIVSKQDIYARSELLSQIHSATDFGPFLAGLEKWAGATSRVDALVSWVPPEWSIPLRSRRAVVSHILRTWRR
jgi:hypothetical protein